MGNEHSKNIELLNTIGTIPEMLENVKGISANISSNGMEITEAAVVSQILETILLKEEMKENNVDQTDVCLPASDPQTETANLKPESESLTEPESVTLVLGPEGEKAPESDNGKSQPVENQEDSIPEKTPVMNFFKTLVTVKVIKKETDTADATKDQSQKENQPAATTTVAQVSEPPAAPKGMSIPPPPPPEPPKMEIKAEPAAKASPKEEPKADAKESESPKGKSAKVSLGKFFRSKVLVGVKASKGKASASGANAPAKSAAVVQWHIIIISN
ncbi:histone H1-like isoform X2 [Anarrhichthys ocellatus]|uniref:histone H1-like isoform X2 n=1 Tax=Anarrhichthys ocellatus TaxID=433405 RepID=UPI0012EE2302|nr:histone H1-like isoform X2 [Anarrhichthys ocellatus]